MKIVLSGDIGGTSTRLQLTQFNAPTSFEVLARHKYQSHQAPRLTDLISQFLETYSVDLNSLYSACFAVAGPIIKGRVKFTNLPWEIDETTIKQLLNIDRVQLINDFQAIGYGIETLAQNDIVTLQQGEMQNTGPKALIGAGTGLGVGLMHWAHDRYEVAATEGGHVDFAPTTDTQIQLLQYLRKKLRRVSVERVVSGQGLENIYRFVRDNPLYGEKENPDLHFAIHSGEDVAASIAKFATEQHDPMSMRALKVFMNVYGSAAGNLALTTLPTGGLYIVGGIAPKLLPYFQTGAFMEQFLDKGRMSTLLASIPVKVVLDTHIGLQGSANYAANRL